MPDEQIKVKLNPDCMPSGSDLAVVNAARKSFNQRSEWEYPTEEITDFDISHGHTVYEVKDYKNPRLKEKDKRLIEFLARGMTAKDFEVFKSQVDFAALQDATAVGDGNELTRLLYKWRKTPEHSTPFNHGFFSFEMKVPLNVLRQIQKTRFTILSEPSGRYIKNLEFFTPSVFRLAPDDKKQGSGGPAPAQYHPTQYFKEVEEFCVERYNKMVDQQNICMEQARMILPQNMMVECTMSATFGAWANMCVQRLGEDAQYESRLVAQQVYKYLKEYYPVSAKALVEGPDV